jgi:hypothetical protein
MKLSRRVKRTKCTKRTKRFKLKRNTKKQFRQYKRKNTYRKHSHKLRKNKRVMRGGVEKVYPVYSEENVNLKYKTNDSSFMNRARGFMDKFQEGTFRALLSFDGGDEGNKNKFDIDNSVFQKNYAVNGQKVTQHPDMDVFPKNAEYHFTLMMGKEKKTFTVKFTLTVKQYRVSLVTYTKYTAKEADTYNPYTHGIKKKTKFMDIGETENKFTLNEFFFTENKSSIEITYSDGTGEETTILGEGGKKVDSISIKSNNDKTYTFPFPDDKNNDYSKNYSFFWIVLNKCKEKVIQLMKTEISAIEPRHFTVNPNVNEYPSRIIQSPTDTHTPTPAPEGLKPSEPVSVEDDDEQPQPQPQPQLTASG